MSTAAPPLVEPITDDEVRAFSRALDDTPPPVCDYRDADGPCGQEAVWRLRFAPCRHSWLLCGEHRDYVEAALATSQPKCGRCEVRIVARDWMPL